MRLRLKDCVPLPFRRIVRALRYTIMKRSPLSPIDAVKANTKEAFEYFFSQDEFIIHHYLEPSRLALYELIADYCVNLPCKKDSFTFIRIADIGCGTGHMLEALRRKFEPVWKIELFGLDFASTAIERARTLLPRAQFIIADLYNSSLPLDFFDLVLCIETLEHLRYPEKAVFQLLRICKPGGDLIITVPNGEKDSWDGHINFWNDSQFRDLLFPHGLIEIRLLQDDTVLMARLVKRPFGVKGHG